MSKRIAVDQIIDAAPARVVVTRDAEGAVTQAAFDLAGLPRVDALLTGRPVVEVPGLVERLCGICPTAHHLAGMRALEAVAGLDDVPPTAAAVRRLLHYAGVIATHAVGLFATDPGEALELRRFAKAVMTAAGSPGHFPVTAVPGGVVAPVDPRQRDACLTLLPGALSAAQRVAGRLLAVPAPPDRFGGADVALTDEAGALDLFGSRLRAVAADGTPVIAAAQPSQWDSLVAEAAPGTAAPRPYVVALGAAAGSYRVGPVAQLRIAAVPTPIAAGLQRDWRQYGGGAAGARAVIVVHAVEAIGDVLRTPELVVGQTAFVWPPDVPAAVGVGWVDSARGLLVHRYATTDDGSVRSATILTPTAQNEPWLGEMLRTAVAGAAGGAAVLHDLEDAIREADPCLPCSSVPAGTMDLVVDTVPATPAARGS